MIDGVSNWSNGEKLKEEYNFIVCNRLNYIPNESNFPKNYRTLEEFVDASSTRIRDRINDNLFNKDKLNLGINGLTTQSVISYIIKNELYSISTATGGNNEKTNSDTSSNSNNSSDNNDIIDKDASR